MTASSASLESTADASLGGGSAGESIAADALSFLCGGSYQAPALERHAGPLERHLIERARLQDHEAFRRLVERHQEQIYRLCRQLLYHHEDARDACQDTFVKAHAALPAYRWRATAQFSSWLSRIALNLCRDRLRSASHQRQRVTHEFDDSCVVISQSPRRPDTDLALREDMQKLRRGLDALPPRLREALLLSTLEGLSHRHTAEVLKCSERAVEGRVHRARQRLLKWWERQL